MTQWLTRRFEDAPDETFLTIHRVLSYSQVIGPLLVAAIFGLVWGLVWGFGRGVSPGFMEAMTQIIVVLFLLDEAFLARKIGAIVDKADASDRDLGRRYVRISAYAVLAQFVTGEAAALYGTTAGPTTFVVVFALGIAFMQAVDLAFGAALKGGLRELAFARFLEMTRGSRTAGSGTPSP